MKIKYLLTAFAALVFFSSCEEDTSRNEESDYVRLDSEMSVISDRIQFMKDINYNFRIAVETNYLKEEGFGTKAFLRKGDGQVRIDLYDDGVSDGFLRCDLAASNNIWSGGINAADIPEEGAWVLDVEFTLKDTILLGSDSSGIVYVVKNSVPEIDQVTGLADSDIFDSGFETRTVTVAVSDSNNAQAPYDGQDLKLRLYNISGTLLKENIYKRANNLTDFIFNIDSTYAAGIPTLRNYRFNLETTDMYGESSSIDFSNITIRNFAPSLNGLQYPDTVFIPAQDSVYFSVTVKPNDPQGHLEYQDIKNVIITVNSFPFNMRDDGNENFYPYNSGDILKNDGIYTATFKVKSTNQEAVYPFTIQAEDKVGNTSSVISGQLIFVKETSKRTKRSSDESGFIYINPFN